MNQLQISPTALLLNALFEHGTDDKDQIIRGFDAWEKLGDGRGVTAGYCGFTSVDESGTSDLKQVYARFRELTHLPPFSYDTWIEKPTVFKVFGVSDSQSGHFFRQAQIDVGRELYEIPALELCAELGVETQLGIACIYDAIIQHGDGNDEDSIEALVRESKRRRYSPLAFIPTAAKLHTEQKFIETFNSVRFANLSKPRDDSGTWFESRDRCHALNNLCRVGAWELTLPLHVQSDEYDVVIR